MVRFSLKIKDLLFVRYFGKTRSHLGKYFLHPQKYALPYTYAMSTMTYINLKVLKSLTAKSTKC